MHKKNRQTLVWDNIPEWAIFALEYGIEEELFLPNEDLEMISRFIGENFPNGYTMSVDWESCTEFNPRPAFGKPCKTHKKDNIKRIQFHPEGLPRDLDRGALGLAELGGNTRKTHGKAHHDGI